MENLTAMLFRTGFLVALIINCQYLVSASKAITGLEGGAISLHCNGAATNSRYTAIEWVDFVYNASPEPQLIFSSQRNDRRHIDSRHPNKHNYKVNDRFTLKINGLSRSTDPGSYICRGIDRQGEIHTIVEYYLSVGTPPQCFGVTSINAHDETVLSCNMSFSGNQPEMFWLRENEQIESSDEFDIGRAQKVVRWRARHSDDRKEFTCTVNFGDMHDSCSLTLDVKHHVRDIKILPAKDEVFVGDELKCTAKGNPLPDVSLSVVLEPHETPKYEGVGWGATVVQDKWAGKLITAKCSAVNIVNDLPETLIEERTYSVSGEAANKEKEKGMENTKGSREVKGVKDKDNSAMLVIANWRLQSATFLVFFISFYVTL